VRRHTVNQNCPPQADQQAGGWHAHATVGLAYMIHAHERGHVDMRSAQGFLHAHALIFALRSYGKLLRGHGTRRRKRIERAVGCSRGGYAGRTAPSRPPRSLIRLRRTALNARFAR